MKKIKILDHSMINKIAAGEVVENPSSVVKELVENSIDAGASVITVEISEGGHSMIRVSDNGGGIDKEDILNVFIRHATSKIEDMDDLENVLTLGFRGEAMSSIAAVSKLEMVTKTPMDTMGTLIEINGGDVVKNQSIGVADGTSITVRNLFYNVPARRKFLKRPSTEAAQISDLVEKFALSAPRISFRYILNDKKVLDTNGNGDLKTTIHSVLGMDIAKSLLGINHEKLSGFIARPDKNRANRSYGIFFVNGRFIKNTLMQSAVEAAYKTKLPQGKFPIFVLNLDIEPNTVDVNVHPTKLEVRFSNEELIYNMVYEAISNALNETILIPKHETKNETKLLSFEEPKPLVFEEPKLTLEDFASLAEPPKKTYIVKKSNKNKLIDDFKLNQFKQPAEEELAITLEEPIKKEDGFFKNYNIVGQFFNTYWILEQNGSVYLIDQHAAHERILYDDLLNQKQNVLSQRLLMPQAVNLSAKEMDIFNRNKDIFTGMGFDVEEFGDDVVAIRAVPFIFNGAIEPSFFIEIVDKLDGLGDIYEAKLEKFALIACKAAVKANDKLSHIEAKALIEKILKTENPFTCPHGRPTIVEISKNEIEKMFKRI